MPQDAILICGDPISGAKAMLADFESVPISNKTVQNAIQNDHISDVVCGIVKRTRDFCQPYLRIGVEYNCSKISVVAAILPMVFRSIAAIAEKKGIVPPLQKQERPSGRSWTSQYRRGGC